MTGGGQRYQIPAGYEAYGPGTTISYGGANYVIGGNGTMASAGGYPGSLPSRSPRSGTRSRPDTRLTARAHSSTTAALTTSLAVTAP